MKGLVGRKLGMSQMFATDGTIIPVTMIEIEPNVITQIKTTETDGYNAIQIGVEDKKQKHTTQPEMGHVKKAGLETGKRVYKEFTVGEDEVSNYTLGQELTVDIFSDGEIVDVQGTSKGKGFQGSIKRHNQSRGPMSHGSRYHRRPGSMGAVAPQVFKGKNLPGHMGSKTVTTQNLEIVKVDTKRNVLIIKGNVPGAKKSFVTIKAAVKDNGRAQNKELISYVEETTTSEE